MNNLCDIQEFDSDERLLVNGAAARVNIEDFTQESYIEKLMFNLKITDDKDVTHLLEGLLKKVKGFSAEEWSVIQSKIPYKTYNDV